MKTQKSGRSLSAVEFTGKWAFRLMALATVIILCLVMESVLTDTWRRGDTIAAQGIIALSYVNVVAMAVYLLCLAVSFVRQEFFLARRQCR